MGDDPPIARPWGRHNERDAQQKLRASLPTGSSLESFECRASICRIETNHQGVQEYQAFLHAALIDAETHLWNAAGSAMVLNGRDPNGGPLETVAYLAREGKELP